MANGLIFRNRLSKFNIKFSNSGHWHDCCVIIIQMVGCLSFDKLQLTVSRLHQFIYDNIITNLVIYLSVNSEHSQFLT